MAGQGRVWPLRKAPGTMDIFVIGLTSSIGFKGISFNTIPNY